MPRSEYIDCLDLPDHISRKEYLSALKQDVTRIVEESYHTTDAPALQRWDYQDVFIIGTWKKGFKRHSLLGNDIKPVGVGYTNSENFIMYRTKGGGNFPVILITNEKQGLGGAVYGEIWRVPTKKLFSMDFYESHTIESKRMKLPIRYYDKTGEIRHTFAWVYVGLRNHWNKKIADGELILCDRHVRNTAIKNDVKKYYNYMWKYHVEQSNLPAIIDNMSH